MNDYSVENKRKKLLFRSFHRGCKELDVLLSSFATNFLYLFSYQEILKYEKIIELDDYQLYKYLTEKEKPQRKDISRKLIRKIIDFNLNHNVCK